MVEAQIENGTGSAALAGQLYSLFSRLKRRLRERSRTGDLTPSQVSVLSRLEREGPATVSTLALAEGVRPQSMGATVGVLQAAGFVIGSADPRDGRQTLLSLTNECRDMVRASRAAREDWLYRSIEEKLNPDERVELERALVLLSRLVG